MRLCNKNDKNDKSRKRINRLRLCVGPTFGWQRLESRLLGFATRTAAGEKAAAACRCRASERQWRIQT